MTRAIADAGQAFLVTRPGETIPTRLPAPSIWRVGNLQGLERAHLAFHRLTAQREGVPAPQSSVRVLPLSRSNGTRAGARTSFRIPPRQPGERALNVLIQEFAAFVGLRNIVLGAGWTRIVKTPSPFISTSGAGLAAVLSTKSAAARMSAHRGAAAGIIEMIIESMWVRHPESRLWREVKTALGGLRSTVSSLLDDRSVWEQKGSASAAVSRFVDAFNSAVRTLNRAVSVVEGALAGNGFLEGVEAVTIEAVRGPVAGLPDRLDETAEAGVRVEPGAALSLSDLRLGAAAANGPLETSGDPRFSPARALQRVGVVLESDYTLQFDNEMFGKVFSAEPEVVQRLFAGEEQPGDYADGLPVLRRLGRVLGLLLEPEFGSFRMHEEAAALSALSRPWEAYTKSAANLLGGVLSLIA